MNSFRLYLTIIVASALLAGTYPTHAQVSLDQQYSSIAHDVRFSYASEWDAMIDASDPDFVMLQYAANGQFLLIGFYTPAVVTQMSGGADTIDAVTDALMDFLNHPDTLTIRLGERTAVEALNENWQHLIVEFGDGRFGLVSATVSSGVIADKRELVKSIAMTYSPLSDGQSVRLNATQPAAEPIRLLQFNGGYFQVLQELESLELVPPEWSLVYEHDELTVLEHAGYYAVTMAKHVPRTNVVISAQITIVGLSPTGSYDNNQSCGFVARISSVDDRINGGVELGLFPSNLIGLIDFNSPARSRWHIDLPYDHSAPNHLLMILYESSARVFLNGLQISEQPISVTEVDGVYALTSRNMGDLQCEFRNIWIVELPEFEVNQQ